MLPQLFRIIIVGMLPYLLATTPFLEVKKEAKLQGYDVIVTSEKSVQLKAKLERKGLLGINPDLNERKIEFFLGDLQVGSAKTEEDGTATFSWMIPTIELKIPYEEFSLRLPKDSPFATPPSYLRVFYFDSSKPTLIVDLDGTTCQASAMTVARKNPDEVEVVKGSPRALRELSSFFQIIYLTARDDALIHKTRAWLALNQFPPGPLLVRDLRLTNLSAEKYKKKKIQELKKHLHLFAGVGDRDEDAQAYLSGEMISILIRDESSVPEGSLQFENWNQIKNFLKSKLQEKSSSEDE